MKLLCTALLSLALFAFAGCGAKNSAGLPPAPSFSSAAASDYVKAYTSYVDEAMAAYKSKDAAKIAALSSKGQALLEKGTTLIQTLKGADAQKLEDWLTQAMEKSASAMDAAEKGSQ